MGRFGGLAEGFGHYFCFAEEYSNVPVLLVYILFCAQEVGVRGWDERVGGRERKVWDERGVE